MSSFALLWQEKVTKEVNFILANQETIQSQITQLEAAIKQMEVSCAVSVLTLTCDVPHTVCWLCNYSLLGLIEVTFPCGLELNSCFFAKNNTDLINNML